MSEVYKERIITKIVGGKSREVIQRKFIGKTIEDYDEFLESRFAECTQPIRFLKGSYVELDGRLEHKTYEFMPDGDITFYN